MTGPEQYLRPEVARRVRRLDLKARFIVEGFLAGLHQSPYRGLSLEFAEHRRYASGDDPKTLDWAAWAKTDRLYVRTFQAETNLSAYLVLDRSRSMAYGGEPRGGPDGRLTKLDYARSLAAALGYLLIHQHDAVGLALLGSDLERFLPARPGRRHLARVLADLERAEGRGKTALAPALHALARRVKRRSLIVLLSDLVDEPQAVLGAMRHLAFRGHGLVVFQVLDPVERRLPICGPVLLEDPETGARLATDADHIRAAYTGRLEALIEQYRRGVAEAGGDFAALTTSTPFDRALMEFLRRRARPRMALAAAGQ